MRYTRESKKIKKQGVAGAGGGSSSLFTRVTRETVLYLSNKKKAATIFFFTIALSPRPFFLKRNRANSFENRFSLADRQDAH
jgi:hypothetical protein